MTWWKEMLSLLGTGQLIISIQNFYYSGAGNER